ncbi:hypothetical protein MYXA107069_31905 [Myxococcus xanthus]
MMPACVMDVSCDTGAASPMKDFTRPKSSTFTTSWSVS